MPQQIKSCDAFGSHSLGERTGHLSKVLFHTTLSPDNKGNYETAPNDFSGSIFIPYSTCHKNPPKS